MLEAMPRKNKYYGLKHGHLKTSTYSTYILLTFLFGFIFQCPLGDPCQYITLLKDQYWSMRPAKGIDYICEAYKLLAEVVKKVVEMFQFTVRLLADVLYQVKIKIYKLLAVLDAADLCQYACLNDANIKEMKKIRNKASCS